MVGSLDLLRSHPCPDDRLRDLDDTAMILSLGGYLIVLRVFLKNRWAGRTVEPFSEQTDSFHSFGEMR